MKLSRFALTHPEFWGLDLKTYELGNEASCKNTLGISGSVEVLPLIGNALYSSDIKLIEPDYYRIVRDYLNITNQEDNIAELLEDIGWGKENYLMFTDILAQESNEFKDVLAGKGVDVGVRFNKQIVYPYIIKPILLNNRNNINGKILIYLPEGLEMCSSIRLSADKELRNLFWDAMGTYHENYYVVQFKEHITSLFNLNNDKKAVKVTIGNIDNIIELIKEKYNGYSE